MSAKRAKRKIPWYKFWFNSYLDSASRYGSAKQPTHHQVRNHQNLRIPYAMFLISVIISAFFVINLENTENIYNAKHLEFNTLHTQQVWRFITYMLVHVDRQHLLSNMVYQILFASPLEMVHGSGRVVLIYLCAVLLGSVGFFINSIITLTPDRLVGASAGTYSMLTVHLALIILNWKKMYRYKWAYILFLIAAIVFTIGQPLYQRFYLQQYKKNSNVAHVWGGMTGLIMGLVLFKNDDNPPRGLQILGIVFYVLLFVIGLRWNLIN